MAESDREGGACWGGGDPGDGPRLVLPLPTGRWGGRLPGAGDAGRLFAELTPLQRDVALLVMSGATNSEIARELHLSPHTVRNCLSRIMMQFGARNRTELAVELATVLVGVRGSA